ncbi:phage tail tape measure protein [Neobacillus vireti]|uniref:phage tail tape measure protein n=1 Tax=Neobacillus vireti TaxID=220686 RepID=UPI002FFEBDB3
MSNGMNISFTISAIDDFSRVMSNLQGQTQRAFDAIGVAGKAITGLGMAGAAGLGVAIKTSMDFEAQLSRVGAIAGATGADLDALRKSAMELGASSSKSATEIAQGQEALAALGFTTKDILGAMPGVIAAAEASGSDMAQTAEVMASTLNIFGLSASKATDVADVLAKTANISAANLTDMQYAIKYAGPPAAALGVSLEDLSASIGIMTNAGMGGEQAGTTLRAALLSLLNPSEQNSKLMTKMGIAVTDAKGNFVGLSQLVKNLSTSMAGMTETQKAANLAQLVGTESVSGMLSLMKAGPAEIDKMSNSLKNSAGVSAEAAAKMKDNLKGALNELSGSFETLLITIGTALTPAVQALASVVQSLLDKFNGLSPQMQKFIAIGAAVAVVFALIAGPALMFIGVIPSIVTGFTALVSAFTSLGPVIAAITGPIGLIIAGIVGIGVALVAAYQHVSWFRDNVNAAWEWIKTAWSAALTFISGIVQSVMSAVSSFIGGILGDIKAFWSENGAAIMTIVQTYFSAVGAYISVVMSAIKAVFQVAWPIIVGVIKVAWALIESIVSTAINLVLGIISAAMKLLQGDWKGAWNTIKSTAKTIMDNIIGYFKGIDLVQVGRNIIQGLVNGISGMIGTVKSKVAEIAALIPDGVKKFLGIHSPSRVMMEIGGFTGEGFQIGMADQLTKIQATSRDMANAAVPNVRPSAASYSPAPVKQSTDPSLIAAIRDLASRPVTVAIDGRNIAVATIDHTDSLLASKSRNTNRMTGLKR